MLQDRGHQVAVIAPSESLHSSNKKIDNLTVYGVPSLSVNIRKGSPDKKNIELFSGIFKTFSLCIIRKLCTRFNETNIYPMF